MLQKGNIVVLTSPKWEYMCMPYLSKNDFCAHSYILATWHFSINRGFKNGLTLETLQKAPARNHSNTIKHPCNKTPANVGHANTTGQTALKYLAESQK